MNCSAKLRNYRNYRINAAFYAFYFMMRAFYNHRERFTPDLVTCSTQKHIDSSVLRGYEELVSSYSPILRIRDLREKYESAAFCLFVFIIIIFFIFLFLS